MVNKTKTLFLIVAIILTAIVVLLLYRWVAGHAFAEGFKGY